MKPSSHLRKLIRGCVDDGHTLHQECRRVNAQRAKVLSRLASEREQFVEDLERLADREAPRERSWKELLREAAHAIWVNAAGRNDGDAIRACRRSRNRTEALYDRALQAPWPDETRRVLTAQRDSIRDENGQLNKLRF